MDIKEKIKSLPDACGVYVMRSAEKEILYIGKAVSLKKRLAGHARRRKNDPTAAWLNRVAAIEYIRCDSEEQALILEASLIKEKKPRYNVALRDDKSFPYVIFSDELFPRIYVGRVRGGKAGRLCGPFVNAGLLRSTLKMIRKIFPFRSCRIMPGRPCLYYHLRMCTAPCAGKDDLAHYRESIDNIYDLLSGEKKKLLKKLGRTMKQYAAQMKFEQAACLRDTIAAVNNLYSGICKPDESNVLKEVLRLKKIPLYIEAMDISNISGAQAVGSVVVFRNGLPDKNGYRRYRIKTVEKIDDYRMIAEVVRRRYSRLKDEKRPFPDLVLIDGGYGHVRAAFKELKDLDIDMAVIGLAKKEEEIWFPDKRKPLLLPPDNRGRLLLQRIRDEAHRFARKYHVLLRKKKMLGK